MMLRQLDDFKDFFISLSYPCNCDTKKLNQAADDYFIRLRPQ
jgi:hypothetical protein